MKNKLMRKENDVIRILDVSDDKVFLIDCIKLTMPKWYDKSILDGFQFIDEEEISEPTDLHAKRIMHERYSLIAGILPFITDKKARNEMIGKISEQTNISKQTIRKYLCLYLAYQDISVLAPKDTKTTRELTKDEKNIRWALNKFFYTKNKNSLKTAYTMMLKEKYCDRMNNLLPEYPSFYQFRYYYRKHKSLQNFYISRNGLSDYQRNSRPLTGNGIHEFAPSVGVGMLDSTVCDIYLVNSSGELVGRPILTACIDAYSSLCFGYTLSWEGGIYSLKSLMMNVITDKVELCKKFGILIDKEDWNCSSLPSTLVTDMGAEYKSENFEQIAELGVKVINLPPYRPELKGAVEKFFDLIQDSYKPYLKGKGVIEPDYQERGAHDYRKDACLTLEDFEKIILHCIIFYNTQRIIENFSYTNDMIQSNIKPYANCIWNFAKTQAGANLIDVDYKTLMLTLLPRTKGTFTRFGLKLNKLRYTNDNYTEKFLSGGDITVSYNPDDVSKVWIIENGKYVEFQLIETQFQNNTLDEIQEIRTKQSNIIRQAQEDNLKARISLAGHIETIANTSTKVIDVNIKGIRKSKEKERIKNHIDYMREGVINE